MESGFNEFSMLEDQRYILEQVVKICVEEHADALLLAGDIYDRPIPPTEAVMMLDWFFNTLAAQKLKYVLSAAIMIQWNALRLVQG